MTDIARIGRLEKTLKALANRRRLAIVKYLKEKNRATVGEIASVLRLSFRSTSRHLGVLTGASILDRRQQNLYMIYSLPPQRHALVEYLILML